MVLACTIALHSALPVALTELQLTQVPSPITANAYVDFESIGPGANADEADADFFIVAILRHTGRWRAPCGT
jgi:hypothetical protein